MQNGKKRIECDLELLTSSTTKKSLASLIKGMTRNFLFSNMTFSSNKWFYMASFCKWKKKLSIGVYTLLFVSKERAFKLLSSMCSSLGPILLFKSCESKLDKSELFSPKTFRIKLDSSFILTSSWTYWSPETKLIPPHDGHLALGSWVRAGGQWCLGFGLV